MNQSPTEFSSPEIQQPGGEASHSNELEHALAPDMAGLRLPAHVVADLEPVRGHQEAFLPSSALARLQALSTVKP